MKFLISVSAAALMMSGAAIAQDYTAQPAYGSVNLNSGFSPDPHAISVAIGGERDASGLAPGCVGSIANAPDYSVYYQAGSTFDLSIYTYSDVDTTLVINDPYGNWACNDDSNGLNPAVTFTNPASGRYDIWVGSYWDGNDYAEATLYVSELGTSQQIQTSGIDWSLPAAFGNVSLQTGFQPDPYRVSIISGGSHRASEVRNGCAGWVASAPDFQLSFAGDMLPLIISAASDSDTTLLVNDPNGNWHCNDDGGNAGWNPALTFNNPASGTYDIWIGSYSQGDAANVTLSISELYSE